MIYVQKIITKERFDLSLHAHLTRVHIITVGAILLICFSLFFTSACALLALHPSRIFTLFSQSCVALSFVSMESTNNKTSYLHLSALFISLCLSLSSPKMYTLFCLSGYSRQFFLCFFFIFSSLFLYPFLQRGFFPQFCLLPRGFDAYASNPINKQTVMLRMLRKTKIDRQTGSI